ncbi:MAG: hypothetical protein QOI24_2468 [Acidobacteriota bacterium]|jgi:hypothetical protein|nr:hypothetical protein [Acidobacteriota bacterium]
MKYLHAVIFVAVVLISSVAFAGTGSGPPSKDPVSDPCEAEIDTCFHEGDWWYTSLIYYDGSTHTHTDCGLSEGCKACGQTSQGAPVCAKVMTDSACTCEIIPVPGAGPNIVQCSAQGTCYYRH